MNTASNQPQVPAKASLREHVARLRLTLMARCAGSRPGRVLLHLLCACADHELRWHLQGIARELAF